MLLFEQDPLYTCYYTTNICPIKITSLKNCKALITTPFFANPLTVELIYLMPSTKCAELIKRLNGFKCSDFMKENENDETTTHLHFKIDLEISWFFGGYVFYVENLPNPAAMSKLSIWSASIACQVLSTKYPKC